MTSLPKVVSIEELRRLRNQRTSGRPEAPPEGNVVPESTDELSADDRAVLDAEAAAEERARIMAEMREALDDLPDVRMDKVIEARQRIATGFYDKDRVRLDILTALLGEESGHDLGLPPKTRPEADARTRTTRGTRSAPQAEAATLRADEFDSADEDRIPDSNAATAKRRSPSDAVQMKKRVKKDSGPKRK